MLAKGDGCAIEAIAGVGRSSACGRLSDEALGLVRETSSSASCFRFDGGLFGTSGAIACSLSISSGFEALGGFALIRNFSRLAM